MSRSDCPICGAPAVADENLMFWCERCELVWFRWSREQEQRRLDEVAAYPELAPNPLHLVS